MVNLSHTAVSILLLFFAKASADDGIPEACQADNEALLNCTALLSDGGGSCIGCWDSSIPQDATDCSSFESQFCAAFSSCDCGSCDTLVVAATDCAIDTGSGGDICQIDCGSAIATSVPDPGTAVPNSTIPEVCQADYDTLLNCTASLPDGGASCIRCWSNSNPQDATDCNILESQFCAAFASCDCGSCDAQVFAVTDCAADTGSGGDICQIDCGTMAATMEPKPGTAVPNSTIPEACQADYNAFVNCTALFSDGGGSCIECWSSSIPQDAMDCSSLESQFCANYTGCDCGSCDAQVLALTDCLVDTGTGGDICQIDCGTMAATMDPKPGTAVPNSTIPEACQADYDALLNCTASLPDGGASCIRCWSNSIPQDATDCNILESQFCATYAGCDCGSCDAEVFALTDCAVDTGSGGDICQIDCGTMAATMDPKPGTAIPNSTFPEACQAEYNAFLNCAALLSDGGVFCIECWSSSIPQDATDCNSLESQFCASFVGCDCGSCDAQVFALTDCAVDTGSGGDICQIDCGTMTATMDPKPGNTIPEACQADYEAFLNCAALLSDGGLFCVECWSSSIPQDATDCNSLESQFCAAFASCDCGSCDTLVIAVTDCAADTGSGGDICQIDCGTMAATMDPKPGDALPFAILDACTEQATSLISCVIALPDEGDSCIGCWVSSIPEYPADCSGLETQFCADFASCDCGSCNSDVISIMDCLVDESIGGDGCQVDCEGDSGNIDTGDNADPNNGGSTSSDSLQPNSSSLAPMAGLILALALA